MSLKQKNYNLLERKRQDVCISCGAAIIDHEKECPRCGAFPQKAYHERSASQILGISKWLQNTPTMQPNQKLTETQNFLSFSRYIVSKNNK